MLVAVARGVHRFGGPSTRTIRTATRAVDRQRRQERQSGVGRASIRVDVRRRLVIHETLCQISNDRLLDI